jgi:outer membrane protein OmpA-like peptidoglycan-associated protein
MFKRTLFIIVSTFLSISSASFSKEKLYLGGFWGQPSAFSGETFKDNADGDETWGLYLGHKYNEHWSSEVGFEKQSYDSVDLDAEYLHVGAAYRIRTNYFVSPVFRFGVGYNQNKVKGGDDESGIGAKIGGGLEFHFPIVTLTALADWRYLDKVSSSLESSQALSASIGLIWPPIGSTGSSEKATAAVPEKKMVMKDADADGVADDKDKCPNTSLSVAVNSMGCAQTEAAVFQIKVEFKSGSTVLEDVYFSEVEELSKLMKENPETHVEIAGHTDSSGKEATNLRLSTARAKAVAIALSEKYGVDTNRIASKGYGSSQPVADNSTDSGRKSNRRVEARISFKKEVKK